MLQSFFLGTKSKEYSNDSLGDPEKGPPESMPSLPSVLTTWAPSVRRFSISMRGPKPWRMNKKWLLVIAYYLIGCLFFCLGPEQWTVDDAVYFLSVTFTTVGYGDVSPKHNLSRLVGIIFIFVGLVVVFPVLADVAVYFVGRMEKFFVSDDGPVNLQKITRQHNQKLAISLALIVVPITIGIVFFHVSQVEFGRWHFIEALWWTIATVTTVGYGDLHYKNHVMVRLFLTFFIPLSTVSAGAAIANLSNARSDLEKARKELSRSEGTSSLANL